MKIKLTDDTYLVADANSDSDYKEIVLYVEKDGLPFQDLAIVRESYHYEDEKVVPDHGKYDVLVFEDEFDESYTSNFHINEYEEEKITHTLASKSILSKEE